MTDAAISRRTALAGLAAAGILPGAAARAQQYPTRPVK